MCYIYIIRRYGPATTPEDEEGGSVVPFCCDIDMIRIFVESGKDSQNVFLPFLCHTTHHPTFIMCVAREHLTVEAMSVREFYA